MSDAESFNDCNEMRLYWKKQAKDAEAKLAKAREALIRIDDLTCHNMPMTAREEQGVNREARAALAELEDKTDD